MEPISYGQFIRHHRLASGYKSMRSLADATGVSEATISRAESEISKPTPETVKALAKKLHTTSLVELMVVCGYWDEEELLEPIQEIKESSVPNEKELSEIPIEELANHTLTYKGHVLSEDEKQQFLTILKAAEAMIEKNRGS